MHRQTGWIYLCLGRIIFFASCYSVYFKPVGDAYVPEWWHVPHLFGARGLALRRSGCLTWEMLPVLLDVKCETKTENSYPYPLLDRNGGSSQESH